jgi:ADP-heptose:LPS heptosyltransferase
MASLAFPEFIDPLQPSNLSVRRCALSREQASHRILIQRNGAHGDILMATPLLTALRDTWPDAHITWVVERKEAPSIDAHPFVDELLLWDSAYWKRMVRRVMIVPWFRHALAMRRLLQQRKYDVFISFQPEEWQLLARGCGAPVRIGVFDTFRQFGKEKQTSANTRYYTDAFVFEQLPPHRTDQYLLPLKSLAIPLPTAKKMVMGFLAEDEERALSVIRDVGIGLEQPIVVLAPMTTWSSRCWPAERYAELADRLDAEGCAIIVIGSAREEPAVRQIAAQMKHTKPIIAAGTLSFREMAALIARANLLISGDTGPMHVAAAVGTPYLALFGPTPAEGRAPLAGRGTVLLHPVPCGPCDQKICPNPGEDQMLCMRLITVEEVVRNSLHFLSAIRREQ